ncbi:phospho-N-acetylmuramoyl-pentapeptide-transferase [Porphyromonas crevioricanis]|uniref:Phospho-N-acetylmuramoyl-pentapeptide-transferase n=2 Tax=Porphyromonas crevioricanis TaxID=393921 RepID=A0A0A2FJK4_9PORP|nr:phospho-N-acetylmuramoyl-pentapeptide-transferase [Porphyromonas crevioricanis]KGN90282.1 phospho-N-acetylmuramoyl-pentapeptide-transferase [Porphyromonas crevioricanis]KGN95377.1 phospho-N-acetylmuramoyl-pentapeptide-transferase [Porphyromonas crevioricanis]SKA04346.1 Phospho-N-acetylmuramoyl-pentapeptide-transferase [Porphyromonas crevioricanis]SQH72720.1 Phospho-N-acetylmuramoyl-pentapeptide-transferase [Porphyromonas crevioricanis]GAD04844.1 phospho-N-acetylmuramoyl-pentapeptide-transfe
MLYHLFDWLEQFSFPGARLGLYVSFRASLALIVALLISTIIGNKIIRRLQRLQIGETIRDLGLEGQLSKKGTPTMGGIIIIISILLPVLLLSRLDNVYILLMIISTLLLGILGFMDDYIKVFKKNKEGLHGRYKIYAQVGLGMIVGLVLYLSPAVVIKENSELMRDGNIEHVSFASSETKSTKTTIPFVKNNNFDYADLIPFKGEAKRVGSWLLFVLVTIFIVTLISNCVNLTDGLDGLASGSSAIVGVVLGIFAYVSSHIGMASYLNIMFIPGAEELTVFAMAFVGATIGFLWYNAYPAQVFMGDTGSLTIGGIIAVFAIIIRKEMLLPILCGVFIAEGLSVILQVAYFKYTKHRYGNGRRIFKMTPLHHHFQKPGRAGIEARIQQPLSPLPESKITVRFWLIGLILAAVTIATLKMR